jgi:predicted ATPase
VVISAIEGMGGVGKSALAIHAAHQLADAFPDRQLYLNLHGATPGLAPLEPIAALERLLQSLGVPAGQVPAEVDAAAARWRSIASDRRLLIVLDNAATAAQVLPLLPGSATSAVLITSRRVLTALSGATHLPLDTLTSQEAVELVARLAGPQRVAAEQEAANEIARLCGYLPLALRLAGARLVSWMTGPARSAGSTASRPTSSRSLSKRPTSPTSSPPAPWPWRGRCSGAWRSAPGTATMRHSIGLPCRSAAVSATIAGTPTC